VNLSLAMPDPLFPSYVSGHSTVSKAAAEVLAVMVPAHAAAWRQMAVDARESRLAAGIHFPVDNRVGFQLGADVAAQVVSDGHLQPLTDG
jgi:membrane-associated phospholipid phosphatase